MDIISGDLSITSKNLNFKKENKKTKEKEIYYDAEI
jgi:hypothetical protein